METPLANNNLGSDIALILRDFLRTIKAVCMYPENNSLPQSLRQALAGRMVDHVEDYGQFRVSIDKAAISLNGEVIHRDKSREDNLADIFFSAGITEIGFRPGLTVASVNRLLSALREYITAPAGDQDLPALLWEADISGFEFQTAEDISLNEYDANFRIQEYFREEDEKRLADLENAPGASQYESIFLSETALDDPAETPGAADGNLTAEGVFEVSGAEAERLNAQTAAEAMGLSNLPVRTISASLILNDELKLSHEEQEETERLLAEDASFDMYESTSQMLIELLFQEDSLKGMEETATICEKMLSEYIRHGQFGAAALLLESLRRLAKEIQGEKPNWAERIFGIIVTSGSRDRLQQLVSTLNEHEQIFAADLRQYLDVFDWQALAAITDLLGELQHRHHREAVCGYLVEKGRGKEEILARGIYDKRWYVVRNSVMILGHIGDDRSLNHLNHTVKHADRRVRLELVAALKGSENPKAFDILRQLVYDGDADIRAEALNTILVGPGAAAFGALSEIVLSDSFETVDPKEQLILLVGYSRAGKEQAVAHLERLICRFNPFRNPIRSFFRKAAFQALESNPSERAGKLLDQLAGSWRPDIRKQAIATRKRRQQNLGGTI